MSEFDLLHSLNHDAEHSRIAKESSTNKSGSEDSQGILGYAKEDHNLGDQHGNLGSQASLPIQEELEERNQMGKRNWSVDQENILLELHNSMGNCWTQIGNRLNKSHNTVKNHFYAEIRKSVRRVNSFISHYFPKKFKELNLGQISKVITLLSEKKKEIPNLSGLNVFPDDQIANLKQHVFSYAKYDEFIQLKTEELVVFEKFLNEVIQILSQLKSRGLIGKKNSAYKQARQAKLKNNEQLSKGKTKKGPNNKKVTKQEVSVKQEDVQSFLNQESFKFPHNQKGETHLNQMNCYLPWNQFYGNASDYQFMYNMHLMSLNLGHFYPFQTNQHIEPIKTIEPQNQISWGKEKSSFRLVQRSQKD